MNHCTAGGNGRPQELQIITKDLQAYKWWIQGFEPGSWSHAPFGIVCSLYQLHCDGHKPVNLPGITELYILKKIQFMMYELHISKAIRQELQKT